MLHKIKLKDEMPSIGIILCKEKNRVVVEYALQDTRRPISIATYKLTKTLPADLKKYLPSAEEIIEKMEKSELLLYNFTHLLQSFLQNIITNGVAV